jgi:hypothetical protein
MIRRCLSIVLIILGVVFSSFALAYADKPGRTGEGRLTRNERSFSGGSATARMRSGSPSSTRSPAPSNRSLGHQAIATDSARRLTGSQLRAKSGATKSNTFGRGSNSNATPNRPAIGRGNSGGARGQSATASPRGGGRNQPRTNPALAGKLKPIAPVLSNLPPITNADSKRTILPLPGPSGEVVDADRGPDPVDAGADANDTRPSVSDILDAIQPGMGDAIGGGEVAGAAAPEQFEGEETAEPSVASAAAGEETAEQSESKDAADLAVVEVRFVDAGLGAHEPSPRYRVTLHNAGPAASGKFDVALLAGREKTPTKNMLATKVTVDNIEPGATHDVDVRLPADQLSSGTTAKTKQSAFRTLFVLADAAGEVDDNNQQNNSTVLDLSDVRQVELKILATDVSAADGDMIIVGEGFGTKPGRVILECNGLKFPLDVLAWDHIGARVRLPKIALSAPVAVTARVQLKGSSEFAVFETTIGPEAPTKSAHADDKVATSPATNR